jgi:hypothetical protein
MRTALIVLLGVVLLAIAAVWYARRTFTVHDVMTAYAKDAVDAAKRNFKEDLDYSEESIRLLEKIVGRQNEEYVKGPKPSEQQLQTFSKMWGAYLGEVVRRHHGGEWTTPSDGIFQGLYVLTVKETQTSPPSKVYKRIVDGDGDNLYVYYQVLTRKTP